MPPLYIGLVMRSMPIVREVIARVDAGELGELVSIDATEHLHPEHGAYLARNWRRRAEWGGSYMLDKVCHDFDIFGRIAGARAAQVASFGGSPDLHPPTARTTPRAYDDGEPAYAARDAGWSARQRSLPVGHGCRRPPDRYRASTTPAWPWPSIANSHVALQERRWYIAGTGATLIADLVRNRLMIRGALSRGKPERIDFGGVTPTATTAPIRPWPATCSPPSKAAPPSRLPRGALWKLA